MVKNTHWQSLPPFESYEFVARRFRKTHNLKPSVARVSQVRACFIQGREYFSNATTSAMTVKPLLLYYGPFAPLVRRTHQWGEGKRQDYSASANLI